MAKKYIKQQDWKIATSIGSLIKSSPYINNKEKKKQLKGLWDNL
jgi:hypothetical protein